MSEGRRGRCDQPDDVWLLYMLFHPVTRVPFYVGMTRDLLKRVKVHWQDPTSPIYLLMREFREQGLKVRARVLSVHQSRPYWEERHLIESTPGLMNRLVTCADDCACARHDREKYSRASLSAWAERRKSRDVANA